MGKKIWGINFSNLNVTDEHSNGWNSKVTHFANLTDGIYKADGQGDSPAFGINAVDIDWNGAETGLNSTPSIINTTADLINFIKNAYNSGSSADITQLEININAQAELLKEIALKINDIVSYLGNPNIEPITITE